MLTDFGIAKILLNNEETADLTGTGMGVGTPEYMSPEQFQGKGVDARTDVYSLGVVLYEMVTGRKPYQADTPAAVLIKQATEALPRPNQFVSHIPDILEKILLKTLTKKSEDRYQSMEEVGRAFESLLSEATTTKKAQTLPKQPMSLTKKITAAKQPETLDTISQDTKATVDAESIMLVPSSEKILDSKSISFESNLSTTADHKEKQEIKSVGWSRYLIGAIIGLMMMGILALMLNQNRGLKETPTLTASTATRTPTKVVVERATHKTTPSPLAVFAGPTSQEENIPPLLVMSDTKIFNIEFGKEPRLISNIDVDDAFASRDGKKLVFKMPVSSGPGERYSDIFIFDTDSLTSINITNNANIYNNIAISPDGKYVTYQLNRIENQYGEKCRWSTNWGEVCTYYIDVYRIGIDGKTLKLATFLESAKACSWLPDGRKITCWNAYDIWSFSPEETTDRPINITTYGGISENYTWSLDGKEIAAFIQQYDTGKLSLSIINVETGKFENLIDAQSLTGPLSWSPDGKFITYYDYSGQSIYAIDINSKKTQKLFISPSWETNIIWSPDSRWIAYVDGYDVIVTNLDGSITKQVTLEGYNPKILSWILP